MGTLATWALIASTARRAPLPPSKTRTFAGSMAWPRSGISLPFPMAMALQVKSMACFIALQTLIGLFRDTNLCHHPVTKAARTTFPLHGQA